MKYHESFFNATMHAFLLKFLNQHLKLKTL